MNLFSQPSLQSTQTLLMNLAASWNLWLQWLWQAHSKTMLSKALKRMSLIQSWFLCQQWCRGLVWPIHIQAKSLSLSETMNTPMFYWYSWSSCSLLLTPDQLIYLLVHSVNLLTTAARAKRIRNLFDWGFPGLSAVRCPSQWQSPSLLSDHSMSQQGC